MRTFFYSKDQIIQNITSLVMNLPTAIPPGQFITRLVMNFRQPLGVDLVEQSEIAQIGNGKPFAVSFMQSFGEFRQNFFSVCRTFITGLQFLNNFASDQPLGDNHVVIDGADCVRAGLLQNGNHPVKEIS